MVGLQRLLSDMKSRRASLPLSLSRGVRLGTPGGGGVSPVLSNAALLAAAKSDPRIAVLGASRQRQNAVGVNSTVRTLTTSETAWAQALDRRFRFEYWYDPDLTTNNSFSMNGAIFAEDGDQWSANWRRLPKIVASRYNIVIYDMPSGGIQFQERNVYDQDIGPTLTANGYCNNAKQIINYLIAGGKAVIVQSLWERNTSTGGPWGVGAGPRGLIPAINTIMEAWCAENGIPWIDVRSVAVDPASADKNPYSWFVRDGTHHSPIGGYVGAKKRVEALAAILNAAPAPTIETGNKVQNSALAGAAGSATGITGEVATGLTGSRLNASTATVSTQIVTDGNGVRWQEVSIDTSTMTPDTVEGVKFVVALDATVSGTWYQARTRFKVDAWNGWKGTPGFSANVGVQSAAVFPPVNGSGSLDTTVGTSAAPGPSEAYVMEPVSANILASTAVPSMNVSCFFTAGTGIGKFRFAAPQLYPVTDPTLLMYDTANVTVPAMTSPTAISIPEEAPFTHTFTASKPGYFTLAGGDAALIGSPDAHGRMVIGAKDFELPSDGDGNNVYAATATFRPYDLRDSVVTSVFNVTVTNVDDGLTDLFNGASGQDLADYSSNWTRVGGAAGAITIHSNGTEAINNLAVARTAYLFEQQGDTDEQRVVTRVQTVSVKMHRCLRLLDQDNAVYFTENGGNVQVVRVNAGVFTTIATFTPYKSIASNDVIGAQIRNDQLEVWQNDVPLALASGSRAVSGANFLDGVKRTGLLSNTAGGSSNRILDYNNRVAAAHADRVGLKALTMTPPVGTTGIAYEGALSNRTPGGSISLASVTKGGVTQTDWIADGDFIRGPVLFPGETFTVSVKENYSGAVNDGRITVFTVAGS
ncbi:hypothetical protein RU07_20640 [Agrobacterium tumefaciens]|uniref:Uncharacterized protein n=1 Tax=Agrobacterium tumefaciens TaxID=358 RepID=A0A0D0KQ97_AGRTU|nr:hypothetical protein RU07_20640 [Agrobacterium tumefaciens]